MLGRSCSWVLYKVEGSPKEQGEQTWGELPWRWGALCSLTSSVPTHHPAFLPKPCDFLTASAQHKTCNVSAVQATWANRSPGKRLKSYFPNTEVSSVLVKAVPIDMSAAAIGLSLTFSKLEEGQTERRREEAKGKKNPNNTNPQRTKYIHKKCTHSWGWL